MRFALALALSFAAMTTAAFADLPPFSNTFVSGVNTTLTAAGSNVRGLMKNPAGSNHVVNIMMLTASSSAFAVGTILIDPTAGLPTTALPVQSNTIGSGAAPLAQIFFDQSTTAMSGGTTTNIPVSTMANGVSVYELNGVALFTILPGHTLGFDIPFTALNAVAALSIFWTE